MPGDGAGLLFNLGGAIEALFWMAVVAVVIGLPHYIIFVAPGERREQRERESEAAAHSRRIDQKREAWLRDRS